MPIRNLSAASHASYAGKDSFTKENLKLYQQKLAEADDHDERQQLKALVDAEHERLRQLTGSSPPDMA